MSKIIPVEAGSTTIYIESQDRIDKLSLSSAGVSEDELEKGDGAGVKFAKFQETISTFANYSLNSFKQIALANVDTITLEFGVSLESESGIPFIASGKAEGSLKITVECSFPKSEAEPSP